MCASTGSSSPATAICTLEGRSMTRRHVCYDLQVVVPKSVAVAPRQSHRWHQARLISSKPGSRGGEDEDAAQGESF
ncbi:hypothetical protein GUJ93_ZPchr0013g37413 [Zizania palustris]|uniref:Uncharacterized protein n=1 Tax=Zizania palustris TaxID=103762 RepID=A0A8J6C1Y5_ZIZPA|nr:hypothetical protein GUJ93_ZPchr0013g37413 [Zizania palustris]